MEKERHEFEKRHKEEKNHILKEQVIVQRDQIDTTLMFSNLDALMPDIKQWVAKRQREILVRDGIVPPGGNEGTSSHPGTM